jgi:hypothetical protein
LCVTWPLSLSPSLSSHTNIFFFFLFLWKNFLMSPKKREKKCHFWEQHQWTEELVVRQARFFFLNFVFECVCICVCGYACLYVCEYVCELMYMCKCICMCMYGCEYMCTCLCVSMWMFVGVGVCVCLCVCVRLCVYVCVCACVCRDLLRYTRTEKRRELCKPTRMSIHDFRHWKALNNAKNDPWIKAN